MVLVAVGDEDAAQAIDVFFQIRVIRNNQIDTVQSFIWEFDAGVYQHDIAAALENGGVLANFANSPKGDGSELIVRQWESSRFRWECSA